MVEVRIRQRPTYAAFREAERGLARALGLGEPSVTPLSSMVWRPLMWISSRIEASVTLNDEGVTVSQGGSVRSFPWNQIGMAYETHNLIGLVVLGTSAPLSLDKRSMSVTALQEIRHLVVERVVTTPEAMARIRSARRQ